MSETFKPTHRYTDRDGVGIQDPAIRAYGSVYVGLLCERAGVWTPGKALMRFEDGTVVVCRSRLLRRLIAKV
jgi:hypothetical protein